MKPYLRINSPAVFACFRQLFTFEMEILISFLLQIIHPRFFRDSSYCQLFYLSLSFADTL